jgi:hypothetical protein
LKTLLPLVTLAGTVALAACGGGGGSSTPSTSPTPSVTPGPLTASPASTSANPTVLSLTGASGGPQSTTVTFSQSGLSSIPAITTTSNSCWTSNFGPTEILKPSTGSASLENGTVTLGIGITAKNLGTCSVTESSSAGSQTATIYVEVTP